MSPHDKLRENAEAITFCQAFLKAAPEQRYLFGINTYAKSISNQIEVAGFIDDFYPEPLYQGRPVIKSQNVPLDSLVVSTLLGRPLTARKLLGDLNIRHLDYFSFHTYSGLLNQPVRFWGEANKEIEENMQWYVDLYDRLADAESKDAFWRIISFRLTSNLDYLEGFTDRQAQQYFEPFLQLKSQGEIFVDIGGYEGETTQAFIDACPEYKEVYFFEPDQRNMDAAKLALSTHSNIHYIQKGAFNKQGSCHFSSNGSVSTIEQEGDQKIQLDTVDNQVNGAVTFIKMDIEGAEQKAIEGARKTIADNHPLLAISVYHLAADMRTIPQQILDIRDDYGIYVRHYTEGVVETIMFFIPHTRRMI